MSDVDENAIDQEGSFVAPLVEVEGAKPADEAAPSGEDSGEAAEESEGAVEQPSEAQKEANRQAYLLRQARRESREARAAAEDARRQFEEFKAASSQKSTARPVRPDPSKFEQLQFGDDYAEALSKYESDLEAWFLSKSESMTEAKLNEFQQNISEQQKNAQLEVRANEIAQKGVDKYSDFEEVVTDAFTAMQFDQTALQALALQDGAEDIAYHIATNPDVGERISSLDPAGQLLEIGRLASQISAKRKVAERAVTKAQPTPKTPRGASGKFVSSDVDAVYDRFLEGANKRF